MVKLRKWYASVLCYASYTHARTLTRTRTHTHTHTHTHTAFGYVCAEKAISTLHHRRCKTFSSSLRSFWVASYVNRVVVPMSFNLWVSAESLCMCICMTNGVWSSAGGLALMLCLASSGNILDISYSVPVLF